MANTSIGSIQFATILTTGTNGPVQVLGSSLSPSGSAAVPGINSDGTINCAGIKPPAGTGYNGAVTHLSLSDLRGPTGTILTGGTATNTFFMNVAIGSAFAVSSASASSSQQTGSFVKHFSLPPGYSAAAANGTLAPINVIVNCVGTGTTCQIRANLYPATGAGTLDANMTAGTAITCPTASGSTSTLIFVASPGTNPDVFAGSPMVLSIDGNVVGTGNINVYDIAIG